MRRCRRLLVAGLITAAALTAPPLVSPGTAGAAPATTLACGQDVTTDVVLGHDLHCDGGFAFRIATPGVTVDLGGHTVSMSRDPQCGLLPVGDPYPDGCGIDVVADATTLTNGRLVGVEIALVAGPAELSYLQVEDSSIYLTGARLHHSFVSDSEVVLYGAEGAPVLERNWLRSTAVTVTNLQWGLTFEIASNLIERSPGHGVELALACCYPPGDVTGHVTGNWIVGSALDGINAPGRFGESLAAFGELTIAKNLLAKNRGHGVSLIGPALYWPGPGAVIEELPAAGPITIGGNLAYLNGGRGIHIEIRPTYVPGIGFVERDGIVVDSGDNRALFNRSRPNCVGVTCTRW